MTIRTLPLTAALLPLALAGCISFGPKVPPQLLRLSPAATRPADSGETLGNGVAVTIAFPSAPIELSNNRVPVRTGATKLAYVKDAQWVDVPAHLFRDLLAETITARTGRPTLTPRDASLGSGPALGGRLTAFGIDAATHRAIVTYDATLVRSGANAQIRRFEATAPVDGTITSASAGAAIDAAANDVAVQVADWVGR